MPISSIVDEKERLRRCAKALMGHWPIAFACAKKKQQPMNEFNVNINVASCLCAMCVCVFVIE